MTNVLITISTYAIQIFRFIVDCMMKLGVVKSHAAQLADVLIEADVRGHYSHGLNRLDMYIGDVVKKVCKTDGTPTVLKERAGSAWVDGNNLLGPVVGNFCMDLAVKKAKESGVGWVVAKGSNHYGICGWYVLRAMKQGVMALSLTNTSPVMYPTRSSKPALGTNPLSLGASGTGGDSFLLDMATTTVAIGKVLLHRNNN
ncbi:malate/L-lactate dehydrogenase [Dictyocaulus viviparus]|uniref:Malate/L-lactate dehydrogenase n=1 Tax=Dictyocaulus viviparus TaxID=29172 RepID=A0A0D8Y2M0_DICVI|nr:malate/L-lactate dehydrogenase [Dictyocaulus viviparus]